VRIGIDEELCYLKLREVRWPSGITCPLCQLGRVTTHTKFGSSPRRRYLCLHCGRTFTDLTGTPFARTNLPLATWASALSMVGAGRSTSALAKELGVAWDTAAYLVRRLAAALLEPGLATRFRDAVETALADPPPVEAAPAPAPLPQARMASAEDSAEYAVGACARTAAPVEMAANGPA